MTMGEDLAGHPAAVAPPPRGVDRRARVLAAIAFVASFLLTTGAVIALTLGRGLESLAPAVRQPIAFDHKKHVGDLDLPCTTCHVTVETEAFSWLPTADVCESCHSEPQGKSAEEARLVEILKSGKPLAWAPLFRQPAHVFYSHRRHVVAAKIECSVCHGAIAQATAPPGRVEKLRMDDCLDCHRKKGVSLGCTGCHR